MIEKPALALATSNCVGVLGGTFNPIHHAHLRLAIEALERLQLDHVRLLPAAHPPHRAMPQVSPAHRLAMVRLAVAGIPGLVVDGRELNRSGPSYMVDTLSELRTELGTQPLALLLGADAFAELHLWHQWQHLIELAHLVVVQRPGTNMDRSCALANLHAHIVSDTNALHCALAGALLFVDWPLMALSASYIRAQRQAGRDIRFLVPDAVQAYIITHQFYGEPR